MLSYYGGSRATKEAHLAWIVVAKPKAFQVSFTFAGETIVITEPTEPLLLIGISPEDGESGTALRAPISLRRVWPPRAPKNTKYKEGMSCGVCTPCAAPINAQETVKIKPKPRIPERGVERPGIKERWRK